MVADIKTLSTLGITLSAAFASTGSAAQVSTSQPGEVAYASTCASCHGGPSAVISRTGSLNDPATQAQLDRFLARHYTRNAEQRRAIIDYLATLNRR
ncbi:cytochrome c [Microvirga brassicacearum]|uniref:Cytochrome c n=1 Tax=Microvirga brassicacearum TaxID=2580413 RepID=A0A5N3PDM5_9HYPH|nr:cytochrome c [Microvirga brassicacearum]KAB0267829.1 cytochrome c [Microvirga brassicacearum]